jgi:hypothetical protein
MYRSPEQTALVARLRNQCQSLIRERDTLQEQLSAIKLDKR